MAPQLGVAREFLSTWKSVFVSPRRFFFPNVILNVSMRKTTTGISAMLLYLMLTNIALFTYFSTSVILWYIYYNLWRQKVLNVADSFIHSEIKWFIEPRISIFFSPILRFAHRRRSALSCSVKHTSSPVVAPNTHFQLWMEMIGGGHEWICLFFSVTATLCFASFCRNAPLISRRRKRYLIHATSRKLCLIWATLKW